MSYAKALEKLEALPPDEQELASGMYVFEVRDGKTHCGCAIGKLLTEEQRLALVKCNVNDGDVRGLRGWLSDRDERFQDIRAGMAGYELNELQTFNDKAAGTHNNSDSARRERYRLVIDWMRKQVSP